MLKKSLIFGSVALFLAALITLTGCPTSADDDGSSGVVYAHRIYGVNVNPYQAQEAIDRAVAAGEPIVLEDRLRIERGELNFKTAQVVINGNVEFDGGVMSVADATVTWREGSSLELGAAGRYIHRRYDDTTKVTPSALVEFANSLDEIMPTATHAAVRRFQLGPKQDFDYSTSSDGIDARINDPLLTNLYVLEDLVIPTDGRLPNLVITAMGKADVTGAPPSSVIIGSGTLPLGTCSTLTSSKGGIVILVAPEPTTIPNIEVQAGKEFSITQGNFPGSLTIEGKLTGSSTLEVLGAVGDISINGGDGNIRFSGLANPGEIKIYSTGKVTFNNSVNNLIAASEIYSDVVFRGDVATSAPLDLLGNVTLVSAPATAAGAPNTVTLSTSSKLVLGGNKTISLEITPTAAGSTTTIAPILAAGPEDVVITPTAGAVLTASAAPTKNDAAAITAAKRISLGTAGIDITDGTVQVAPGAIFDINVVALTTNPGVTEIGYLAVADGGTLTLSGSPQAGTLNIGDTVISQISTLKASGGTVTLGNNVIAGSAPGAKLAPEKGSAGTLITVNNTDDRLTLEQVELNLAAYGTLRITDVGGRVILTDGAKITLNSGENGIPTELSTITTSGGTARLAGDFNGLTAPGSTTKQAVWSVAHKGGAAADASIIANIANIAFSKSGATFTR
jgi:hypothetical protein